MTNKNEKEEERSMVNEPAIHYETTNKEAQRTIPAYILDDYRISMEQYARGEYTFAEDFLKRIKRGI
jgi:hypothetical protein